MRSQLQLGNEDSEWIIDGGRQKLTRHADRGRIITADRIIDAVEDKEQAIQFRDS